jgi:hypothetical protein
VSVLVLVAGVLVFVGLLKALGAAETGAAALRTARGAAATLSDAGLGDDAKEAAARRAAAALFWSFLVLTGIAVAALGVPALLVWAGSAAGFYPLDHAVAAATGWPFLIGSTLLAVVAWIAMERLS